MGEKKQQTQMATAKDQIHIDNTELHKRSEQALEQYSKERKKASDHMEEEVQHGDTATNKIQYALDPKNPLLDRFNSAMEAMIEGGAAIKEDALRIYHEYSMNRAQEQIQKPYGRNQPNPADQKTIDEFLDAVYERTIHEARAHDHNYERRVLVEMANDPNLDVVSRIDCAKEAVKEGAQEVREEAARMYYDQCSNHAREQLLQHTPFHQVPSQ